MVKKPWREKNKKVSIVQTLFFHNFSTFFFEVALLCSPYWKFKKGIFKKLDTSSIQIYLNTTGTKFFHITKVCSDITNMLKKYKKIYVPLYICIVYQKFHSKFLEQFEKQNLK